MFVLASNRIEFLENWGLVFGKRGDVARAKSLNDLFALQNSEHVCLIMLDMKLPNSNNRATLQKIRQSFGCAKLLLSGIHFDPNTELNSIASGAVGCLNESLPYDECEKIVNVVLEGGVWLSSASIPVLSSRLQNLTTQKRVENTEYAETEKPSAPIESALNKLTKREREVAELVGNGANNKTIARKLLISDRTVKAHLTSIYDKLKISDRLQLALHISAENHKEPRQAAS